MRKPIGFTVLVLATAILLLSGATPALAKVTAQGDASTQSNQWLIHIAYITALHRFDTPPEYVAWWYSLESGAITRAYFAGAIVNSHEKRFVAVNEFYLSYLGRAAGSGEATAWANAMDAGLTWKSLRAKLMASTEFATTFSTAAATDFINFAYVMLLSRAATAGEVNGWVAAMNAGMSRETVICLITSSTEFTYPYVNSLYNYYLDRWASYSEKAMWGNALTAGTIKEEDVVVGLIGSDEFFWSLFI